LYHLALSKSRCVLVKKAHSLIFKGAFRDFLVLMRRRRQWRETLFQEVRLRASVEEAAFIDDITFHDLRHDFGHRLRGQSLSLEEVAYYLGHVNADGTPSIQTTVRYTQVGREQVKASLRQIRNIEGGA
jgi:integrase